MSISKLENGKYRVRVALGGKRVGTVWSTKRDAENQEAELIRKKQFINAGMQISFERVLFFDYAQKWLKKRMHTHPASTWKADETNLRNYWLPVFSGWPMAQIKKSDIEDVLLRVLQDGKSNATHNRVLQCLRKLFEDAIDAEVVAQNPAARIKKLSEKKKVRKTSFWSSMSDIENYIMHAYHESDVYGTFATLALFSGARVSEILALQFGDINFNTNEIVIRRMVERVTKTVHERSKGEGDGGEYTLPLTPRVKSAILSIRDKSPKKSSTDYVLQRSDGSHYSYYTIRGAHSRICQKAEVPYITIHDLRRTFASQLEQAGISRGDIQSIFNHSSLAVTELYIRKEQSHVISRVTSSGFGSLTKL